MKKLKCWKKEKPDIAHGEINSWGNMKGGDVTINKTYEPKEYLVSFEKSNKPKIETFRSKQKAIKFAESHMKKHDKC